MEAKKILIIYVLRILETETDKKHPMTQVEITNVISRSVACDRKTVARNIKFLKEMGYPIVKTAKGFYMDKRTFSRDEIDFVLHLLEKAESDTIDIMDLGHRLFECLIRYYEH